MDTILITGATGYLGRQVVGNCLKLGLPIRIAAHQFDTKADLTAHAPGVATKVRFSFLDKTTWSQALAGCTRLFLLRPPAIGNMKQTLLPFLAMAREQQLQYVVFVSVARCDQMPWTPHYQVEQYLQQNQLPWTIVRPGFFAQNIEQAYMPDIVEQQRIYLPAGTSELAFVDLADIGEVIAMLLADPKTYQQQILTLTGAELTTFAQVAQWISDHSAKPIRYQAASIPGYLSHLIWRRRLALPHALILTWLHVRLRYGDGAYREPTLSQLLNRAPTSMADYIAGLPWQQLLASTQSPTSKGLPVA